MNSKMKSSESKRAALGKIYNNLFTIHNILVSIEKNHDRKMSAVMKHRDLDALKTMENQCIMELVRLKGLFKPSNN